MTDEPTPEFDLTDLLPFDNDANDQPGPVVLGDEPPHFPFVGLALRDDEFHRYLLTLSWPNPKPSFVVLHHTAVPSATWARYPSGAVWDAGEAGMNSIQKKQKRLRQLEALKNYYNKTMFWSAGPHLFVDDEWIYVMSPLTAEGIHAKQGNRDNKGRGYSIGIEVVGYYEHTRWPFAVEHNVTAAVTSLKAVLGTFDYVDQPYAGGVSAHRNYNKPQCPGAAIQPNYYLALFKQTAPTPVPLAQTSPQSDKPQVDPRFKAAWDASGGVWQANRLTPGYPTGPAEERDGVVIQPFERGIAKLNKDNTVSWKLLSEI